MANISIKIENADKLAVALEQAPFEIEDALKAAGDQIGETVLKTRGIRKYPPISKGNMPPVPYWVRGVGLQLSERNMRNSQMMNKKFVVKSSSRVVRISNNATYAKWVIGDEQAAAMNRIGWRRMIDVAKEKKPELERILNAWLNRAFNKIGL